MFIIAIYITLFVMSFGKNLKDIRVEKNISQAELAEKIGVHTNHLSRYERDLSNPSIEVVANIAKALDVSIDELVYGKANNTEAGLNDRDLIGLFKKVQLLNTKQKQTVKDVLDAFVLTADLKKQLG
ncbi:MAG: helix-turn-helix domain-containing protein [Bacteroidota bacterium]